MVNTGSLGYAKPMVFLLLVAVFFLALWSIRTTIRHRGSRIPVLCLFYIWVAQILTTILGFADCGYSVVDISPFTLLKSGHLDVLAIFCPAVLLIALIPLKWRDWSVPILLLSGTQALVFIPVLLSLESQTSISFLSTNTLIALTMVCSSAILAVNPMLAFAGLPGTRMYTIAYRDRQRLVAYLEDLRNRLKNAEFLPRMTILDCGNLSGTIGTRKIKVDTQPSLWPVAYRMRIDLESHHSNTPWLLSPSRSRSLFPESRTWTSRPVPSPLRIFAPPDLDLSSESIQLIHDLVTKYEKTLRGKSLMSTGQMLHYLDQSVQGIDFNHEYEKVLLEIASSLESGSAICQPSEASSIVHEDDGTPETN